MGNETSGEGRVARRPLIPNWLLAAASVVLLFSVFTVYQARQTEQRFAALQAEATKQRQRSAALIAERDRSDRLRAIVSAADTRVIPLLPAKSELPALVFYWNERLGVVLTTPGAPEPGAGFIYQFWLVPKDGDPASLLFFPPKSGELEVHVFPMKVDLTNVKWLVVTEEPAGGSLRPTAPPLWNAQLIKDPRPALPPVEPPE